MNTELEKYVSEARAAGMSNETIRQELSKTGWDSKLIEDALNPSKLQNTAVESPPPQIIGRVQPSSSRKLITKIVLVFVVLVGAGGSYLFFTPKDTQSIGLVDTQNFSDAETPLGDSSETVPSISTPVITDVSPDPLRPGFGNQAIGQNMRGISSAYLVSKEGGTRYDISFISGTTGTEIALILPSLTVRNNYPGLFPHGTPYIVPAGTYDLYVANTSGTSQSFPVTVSTNIPGAEPGIHTRGSQDAAITIETWRTYHKEGWDPIESTLTKILSDYPGQVNNRLRYYQLTALNPDTSGVQIAECAADQGENFFWAMHSYLLGTKGWTLASINSFIKNNAAFVGFDTSRFSTCVTAREKAAVVENSTNAGIAKGIMGTPSILVIQNSTGITVDQLGHSDQLETIIRQQLGVAKSLSLISPTGEETFRSQQSIPVTFQSENKRTYFIGLRTLDKKETSVLDHAVQGDGSEKQTYMFYIPRTLDSGEYLIELKGPGDCGIFCFVLYSPPFTVIKDK